MVNFTSNTYQVKRDILSFSNKVSKNLLLCKVIILIGISLKTSKIIGKWWFLCSYIGLHFYNLGNI